MLKMNGRDLRGLEHLQPLETNEQKSRWTVAQVPRGPRLVLLIGVTMLFAVVSIIIGDSAFSNWGIESNGGWQLISNGHYATRVYAGGRTDQSTGSAYVKGGHTLIVDYDVSVEDGSTFINVYNSLNLSEDALYYESIENDKQGHLEIPVKRTGLYAIDMSYYEFRGDFDVRWHVH
jgi:hypothetical protein